LAGRKRRVYLTALLFLLAPYKWIDEVTEKSPQQQVKVTRQ
jgi:hypothetical protein